MKPDASIVLSHAEIAALSDYAYSQSKARTFNVIVERNVKYVLNGNSTRYRLTPEISR